MSAIKISWEGFIVGRAWGMLMMSLRLRHHSGHIEGSRVIWAKSSIFGEIQVDTTVEGDKRNLSEVPGNAWAAHKVPKYATCFRISKLESSGAKCCSHSAPPKRLGGYAGVRHFVQGFGSYSYPDFVSSALSHLASKKGKIVISSKERKVFFDGDNRPKTPLESTLKVFNDDPEEFGTLEIFEQLPYKFLTEEHLKCFNSWNVMHEQLGTRYCEAPSYKIEGERTLVVSVDKMSASLALILNVPSITAKLVGDLDMKCKSLVIELEEAEQQAMAQHDADF
ncbi:hypothetical protein V8G54_002068 [Vigna mungo]|uniref:Uncharacterized protein n=1 Tax=Vigna mungo TaxID=3915 RepID=A0AAQ3SCI0_VIGMU